MCIAATAERRRRADPEAVLAFGQLALEAPRRTLTRLVREAAASPALQHEALQLLDALVEWPTFCLEGGASLLEAAVCHKTLSGERAEVAGLLELIVACACREPALVRPGPRVHEALAALRRAEGADVALQLLRMLSERCTEYGARGLAADGGHALVRAVGQAAAAPSLSEAAFVLLEALAAATAQPPPAGWLEAVAAELPWESTIRLEPLFAAAGRPTPGPRSVVVALRLDAKAWRGVEVAEEGTAPWSRCVALRHRAMHGRSGSPPTSSMGRRSPAGGPQWAGRCCGPWRGCGGRGARGRASSGSCGGCSSR